VKFCIYLILGLAEDRVKLGEHLLNQDQEEAFDYLTVFRELFCAVCSNVLGKFYFSTTDSLHHLEKQFCLEKDVVSVYCLGQGAPAPNEPAPPPSELPTLVSLKQDVLKLQKLTLHLFGCYQQLAAAQNN